MASTLTKIETVTVAAGGQGAITFSNIPQTYSHLVIKTSFRSASGGHGFNVRFNGDTGSNYFAKVLRNNSGSANSYNYNTTVLFEAKFPFPSDTANIFSNDEIFIPNYAVSGVQKSISLENAYEKNEASYDSPLSLQAGRWSGTDAITSITLNPNSGVTFAQHSTATLYGIKSLGAEAKATGGIITQDANYIYHTFLATDTFTPKQALTAEVLVIAGGGGGGYNAGGGGGAGGLRLLASQALANATAYTATIGGGGSGGSGGSAGQGTNSSFAGTGLTTITASGGGKGQQQNTANGSTGGSGGGAAKNATGYAGNTGSYSPVEGYVGGNGGSQGAGGGGGAGAAGGTGGSNGGTGGLGNTSIAAWLSATGTGVSGSIAGGGGGGSDNTGGSATGGGGTGGNTNGNGTAARVNTGGGGGGGGTGGSAGSGANGGSGLVIVRYAK